MIEDSIQVALMGSINSLDFRGDKGIAYDYQNRQITLFDTEGEIVMAKEFALEGPGSIGHVTNLKILEDGNILVYQFGNKMPLLNEALEVQRYYEMSFPAELRGAAYFQHMYAQHEDDVYLFFPGRDGGNPYLDNFYKDYKLVEKLNLSTGNSESVFKLASDSKYLTDLKFDYPMMALSAGEGEIYLALDTESLIHVYSPDAKEESLITLDFSPSKFVQMEGSNEEYASSYGKMLKGGVKNLFAIPNGVVVHYSEGIEGEVYKREALHDRENWPKLPDFDNNMLKVYQQDKGWSNEVQVPCHMKTISGIMDLNDSFWALRNDDYIGEEQDYLTFYRVRLKQNNNSPSL
ncbi:hypothetical protein [Litoribacter populi]|uniref:hypothetical protein n=1 Tax=Litoribacter populi TaxID=2598460 RepID=UPI00117E6EDF|nr:hypothetical protein [Litoribacter populi]